MLMNQSRQVAKASSRGKAKPPSRGKAKPPSRREQKSEATRRRICEGAARSLFANGYHGTSIKQIADHAGVSQGALQHHFPSKDDLVEATAEFLLTRSLKWFAMVKLELAKDRDAFGDVIRRSWREQFTTDEYGALLEIMTAARTDENLRARIAPKLDNWRDAIQRELRDILHPFAGNVESLSALLNISLCMMTGLLVHEGLLGDEQRMNMMLDQWISLVVENNG